MTCPKWQGRRPRRTVGQPRSRGNCLEWWPNRPCRRLRLGVQRDTAPARSQRWQPSPSWPIEVDRRTDRATRGAGRRGRQMARPWRCPITGLPRCASGCIRRCAWASRCSSTSDLATGTLICQGQSAVFRSTSAAVRHNFQSCYCTAIPTNEKPVTWAPSTTSI